MEKECIENKMHKLENILEYEFKDINNLAKAMNSEELKGIKVKNKKDYMNSALATVGDAVLDLVVCDKYYNDGMTKDEISVKKHTLCDNNLLYNILTDEKYDIINYSYNNNGFYDKTDNDCHVPHSKNHTTYIEAICGAIFYDGGYEKFKEWTLKWLLPKLEK